MKIIFIHDYYHKLIQFDFNFRLSKSIIMNFEVNRLSSFSNWKFDDLVHREELARYGFFHVEPFTADLVKCFSCGVEIGMWSSGDDVAKDHMTWSPRCQFTNFSETNNIPLSRYKLGLLAH